MSLPSQRRGGERWGGPKGVGIAEACHDLVRQVDCAPAFTFKSSNGNCMGRSETGKRGSDKRGPESFSISAPFRLFETSMIPIDAEFLGAADAPGPGAQKLQN